MRFVGTLDPKTDVSTVHRIERLAAAVSNSTHPKYVAQVPGEGC